MNAKTALKATVDFLCSLKPRRKEPACPRRVLVLMCNYIGDTFWAMQAIPLLRQKWPAEKTEIWAGVKPQSAPLLRGLVPDEQVIPLRNVLSDRTREPFSWRGFAQELSSVRAKRFDVVLDLTFNRCSAIFAWLSAAKFVAGCDAADEFGALYDKQTSHSTYEGEHLAFRPLAVAAEAFGIAVPAATPLPKPPRVAFSPSEIKKILGVPEDAKIITLFPGAGWESKRWPAEKFNEAARILAARGFVVAAAGAPSEKELCRRAVAGVKGATTLNGAFEESLALAFASEAVIANDSAPGHLAAAAGVETAMLYCATNPELAALGPAVRILKCECEFSAKHGEQHCAIFPATSCDKPQWMSIDAETVVASLGAAKK